MDSTLDLRPQNLKQDEWPFEDFINLNKPEPAVPNKRGIKDTNSLHRDYGMPNGMQHDHTDGTPNHEMQRVLISGGGLLDRL